MQILCKLSILFFVLFLIFFIYSIYLIYFEHVFNIYQQLHPCMITIEKEILCQHFNKGEYYG